MTHMCYQQYDEMGAGSSTVMLVYGVVHPFVHPPPTIHPSKRSKGLRPEDPQPEPPKLYSKTPNPSFQPCRFGAFRGQ